MTAVLLVGAVPAEIENALQDRGCVVDRTALRSAKAKWAHACDAIVVDLPGVRTPIDDQAVLVWLSGAAENGIRAALSTPRASLDVLSDFYLRYPVHPVIETHRITSAGAMRSVEQLLAGAVSVERERAVDDFEIGSFFPFVNAAQYSDQRSMSLVSEGMQDFLHDLRDAVQAMSRMTSSDQTNPALPPLPWDDNDSQLISRVETSSGWQLKPGVRHNLIDVFHASDDRQARAMLRNTPELIAQAAQIWQPEPPHLLLLGDSGTGKTMIARLVHRFLARAAGEAYGSDMPFVEINCGGMTVEGMDHVLHGAAPGHWTGVGATVGLLAQASYGVAFFDEIGDLSVDAQRRLLTYFQDGFVRPTGIHPFPGFTRVIAATNRNLTSMIGRHEFRHDLLARFARRVRIPPLSERGDEEKRRLVDFVAVNPTINPMRSDGRPSVVAISSPAMTRLIDHSYQDGNFRELEDVVSAAIGRTIRRRDRIVEKDDVHFEPEAFVGDDERSIVHLAAEVTPPGTQIRIAHRRDLERLAGLTSRPMLRGDNGVLWVVDAGLAYRCDGDGTADETADGTSSSTS